MKKGLKIIVMIITVITAVMNVKAEEITLEYNTSYIYGTNSYEELVEWLDENKEIIQNLKDNVLNYYNENYKTNNPYYTMQILNGTDEFIEISLQMYEEIPELKYDEYSAIGTQSNNWINSIYTRATTTYTNASYSQSGNDSIYYAFQNKNAYYEGFLIESNFDLKYSEESYYDKITIENFRNNGDLSFSKGDSINLSLDVTNTSYTEVNLDNYEYVLLSLKDYSRTEAFQTNMQVKGQIGITPIYNFGQTSKDAVTGAQVQDRCNLSYENYTSYPFYIIQSDLQNNAIYAVKECSQGSSFKFDNTVFDVTYITQANAENPTITIDGKTYNVIPYEELPSTATKNEEDNYIPGESGNATDTGGLDSAIKSMQQRMSEIWNTFTYFTDFVGQIFSSLPGEVQTILLSAFTITIVLGLIKIFVGQ